MSDHASLLDLAAELGGAMTPRDKHRFARAGTNHRVGYSTVYLSFYHRLRFRSGVQAFLVDPIACAFCHHGRFGLLRFHYIVGIIVGASSGSVRLVWDGNPRNWVGWVGMQFRGVGVISRLQ